MLWTLPLTLLLEPLSPPRLVADETQSLEDDPVDFFPYDQLGECELLLITQRTHSLVAKLEERAPGQRLLVRLDFILDVELVFVTE